MPKVWSFGCSHVRGAELGLSKYFDTDAWMKERIGHTDIFQISQQVREPLQEEYEKVVKDLYKNTDLYEIEKHYSFSGVVAKKLGYELENHGIRGSGADRTLYNLYTNYENIDWEHDIVFVSFTFTHRFMYDTDRFDGNRNLNYVAGKEKSVVDAIRAMHIHGPTFFSWSAFNAGIYHLIHNQFPKVYLLDIADTMNSKTPGHSLKLIRSNKKTLQDFAKYSIIDGKKCYDLYPQYHYKEYAHEAFADYLIEHLELR